MSVSKMIGRFLSPRKRLLDRLSEVAADIETLAANLTRHTEMCSSPALRARLAELADAETAQANAIRQLALENGVWPKLPANPPHEGSSNWERLRNDLDLQVKILRSLHSQFAEWTGIDPQVSERLRGCAANEDRRIEQLRDLTLRCDPQALD